MVSLYYIVGTDVPGCPIMHLRKSMRFILNRIISFCIILMTSYRMAKTCSRRSIRTAEDVCPYSKNVFVSAYANDI